MKETLDTNILKDRFQNEMIQLVLRENPVILDRYNAVKNKKIRTRAKYFPEVRVEVRNIINNYFEGLSDCFELRVAKEKLLDGKDDTHCHGATAYLIGATNVSSLLGISPRTFFDEAIRNNNEDGDLEVKIFERYAHNNPAHSIVVKDELVFERFSDGYDFKIIPIESYSLHQGMFRIGGDSIRKFKTTFGSLYNKKVDLKTEKNIGYVSG